MHIRYRNYIALLLLLSTTQQRVFSLERTIDMQASLTFLQEHKQAIALIAALCLGLSATRYLLSKEIPSDEPQLITLNETEPNPKTVFLFAHGIDPRASVAISQATAYIKKNALPSTVYTFSFHDRFGNLNFGQEQDIAKLASAFSKVRELHPQAHIVLVGISRGATTILNMLATKQHDWSAIKAAILESPYKSVPSLVDHMSNSYIFFVPYGKKLLEKIVNSLPNYDPHGIQTEDVLNNVPQSIPLFIAYSKTDKTVNPQDARDITHALRAHGSNVLLYAVINARHSTLASQRNYTDAVHDFLSNLSII